MGAGLAGMRAALEAARCGADVAIVTKVHPIRSHSSAAQGGINAAISEDDTWESHAFDTVKGSDYLADQDAVEVMCREAPADIIEFEHMGVIFYRDDEGKLGTPRLRRRVVGAHLFRRRYHRPGAAGNALRPDSQGRRQGLRRVVRHRAAYGRRRLPRPRRAGDGHRRAAPAALQSGHRRQRRTRTSLRTQHQRADLHRRRLLAGLSGRRAADGHGDGAVPSDDACRQRLPDDRSGARRRRLSAQLRGRALHEEVRAEQDGAGRARRYVACRSDRDRRRARHRRQRSARPAPPRTRRYPQEAAADSRDGRSTISIST